VTNLPPGLAGLAERVRFAASQVALFPLVRRLERQLSKNAPVGGDESAEREGIHFSHAPDFSHPGGDVAAVEFSGEGDSLGATLRTTLLGLLGTESTLPEAMSEDVLLGDDEGALQAFFDVFQHRAISLLYRAWRRYSPVAAFDGGGDDGFSKCLQSLVGVDAFSPYDSPRATAPLFALGLSDLSRCEPSYLDTVALEAILGRLFPELSARVVVREPQRTHAENEDLTRLGEAHSTLGVDAAYGDEALDTDGIVRIKVGPVSRAIYEELLPGAVRYRVLQPLLDEWLASRAKAELEVLLPSAEAPTVRLGEEFGSALGVDSRQASESSFVRVRILLLADHATVTPTYHDDV
jgi:type VI secretion system protein ImpH